MTAPHGPGETPPDPPPDWVIRRAARLLRWYPPPWRDRYGEEFTELLVADLCERSRSRAWTADVIRGGLLARLSGAGLTAHSLDPAAGARASLATLACCLASFLVVGCAMWAQLSIGWQWSPPSARATIVAMVVMSAAMGCFAVLALLAALPVAAVALGAAIRRRAAGLRWPCLTIAAGTFVLVLGGHHFENSWPGTGGPWWPQQGLVPGGVAAFGWAVTVSVTSYWAHPAALASFPPAELAWMAISPAALICLVTGITQLVRRLRLPRRVLRYEAWLGTAAVLVMAAFLAGALCWVTEGGSVRQGLFHVGVIDAGLVIVMVTAFIIGGQAVRRAHRPGQRGGCPAVRTASPR